jgi:methyl-accepting chemotaxis protein
MSFRIAQATRAFGIFLALSVLALCAVAWIALEQVRIGSTAYQHIAANKDLTADILPPPLYLVDAHLAVQEIEAAPAVTPQYKARLARMHRDYDSRLAFWRSQKVPGDVSAILFGRSDKAAKAFWALTEGQFIPGRRDWRCRRAAGGRRGDRPSLSGAAGRR